MDGCKAVSNESTRVRFPWIWKKMRKNKRKHTHTCTCTLSLTLTLGRKASDGGGFLVGKRKRKTKRVKPACVERNNGGGDEDKWLIG